MARRALFGVSGAKPCASPTLPPLCLRDAGSSKCKEDRGHQIVKKIAEQAKSSKSMASLRALASNLMYRDDLQ